MTDSRIDTYAHIRLVQRFLALAIGELQRRSLEHDASKLESPEREGYEDLAQRLEGVEYGSDEYRAALRELKPTIAHHYAHNSHHPEYYEQGVRGMTLLDVIEMLCDWKAAGMRYGGPGDLLKSIDISQERYKFSDELRDIFCNTAAWLNEVGDKP